jgi:TPR repeat protein
MERKINLLSPAIIGVKDIHEETFSEEDIHVLMLYDKKEPNWTFMFFDWMTDSVKMAFNSNFEKLYSTTNKVFINGLMYEYGCFNKDIDLTKAFNCYLESARMNNQYALYKLFFIFKDHFEDFRQEQNINLALFFLIKASSYNESFLELNKVEPISMLSVILFSADKDLKKCASLLKRMKLFTEIKGFAIDNREYNYLYHFLCLNFSTRVMDFKKALSNLEKLCDIEQHPEACFKLACLYYNPINSELCVKNINKSKELFSNLVEVGYSRSYSSFYKVCEEQKDFTKAEELLLLGKKVKNFSAQFYANFLSKERSAIISNSEKIFKYFFKSFLYGNLISVVICFEILTKIMLKQNRFENFQREYYLQVIFDFVKHAKQEKKFNSIIDYDVVILFSQIHAFYSYKGILVNKDYTKAVKILTKTFEDKKSFKNYRKIFYYLSKIYKKLGQEEKYEFYLKKTLDLYLILKEFPYHHYVVGTILFKGSKYININLEDALYIFNLGANYKDNYFFINSYYSKKCADFLEKHKDTFSKVKLIEKIDITKYIPEEDICHICYSNFKQVKYKTCNHYYICLLCFDKLKNQGEGYTCPMCKQNSEEILNTFDNFYK